MPRVTSYVSLVSLRKVVVSGESGDTRAETFRSVTVKLRLC